MVEHKSAREGVVCGAHWKSISGKRKRPMIVQQYWSFVTCKSCLKKLPPDTQNVKYLKYGTKIARLRHELLQIGAYQAMRYLDKAADVFHEDVMRILGIKTKKKR